MTPNITSVSLKRFRAFREFEVQGLGRVNLITGKNDTGKSSFLEALRFLAAGGGWEIIDRILREGEENSEIGEAGETAEDLSLRLSSLCYGFPEEPRDMKPIIVAAEGKVGSVELTMHDEDQGDFALRSGINGQQTVRIRSNLESVCIPCEFVGSYRGIGTASLASLWDCIVLTDKEEHVMKALHIIDSSISAVTMLEKGLRTRVAVARVDNIPRLVPLRHFGDGLSRLFGIVLSLVSAKNGLLLIDGFENGLHHTTQYKVWSWVFELARKLDVQVFATSHSWDSIEAFQKAAADTSEAGVLVRLVRKGEDIVPTVFTEEDLAVVTRDRIEVR